MKLTFRQGIVACQMNSATPPVANFLQRSVGDTRYIDLVVSPLPTILTFAHGSSNYVIEERQTVAKAWGPFESASQTFYLYWDINPVSAELTRASTEYPPVSQATWPSLVTPAMDQHWFDTTNNMMKVWNGSKWVSKIRVFAGRVVNSSTILYEPIGASQAGLNVINDAGYIVSDTDGKPMRKNYQGELFTSDTNFYLNFSQSSSAVKLEGSELIATASETIPAFSAVAITGVNTVGLANSALGTKQVVGLITVDLMPGESSNVVFRGNVFNANWNWPLSSVGQSVYCGTTGELTVTRPTTLNAQKVGVILSPQSMFFQVDDETIPAALTASGIQTVSVISPLSVSGEANIVLGISNATSTSAGIMTATDKLKLDNLVVELANEALIRTNSDSLLAPKLNPTFSGTVTLAANPVNALEAATKHYVDNVALSGKENTGVAEALMNAHTAAINPHIQYLLATDFVNATADFTTTGSVLQTVTDHLTAHLAAADPHNQYAQTTNVDILLADKENVGVAATVLDGHVADVNPHTQYALQSDLVDGLAVKVDSTYVGAQLAAHNALANPHSQYLLAADLATSIDSLSTYATLTYVDGRFNTLIGGAPLALDTLNELAAALANDNNFSTSIMTLLAGKEDINTASMLLTGHTAAVNPHNQYALAADMVVMLGSKEDSGTAANAMSLHVANIDPHTQYFNASRLTPAVNTLVDAAFDSADNVTFTELIASPANPVAGKLTVFATTADKLVALNSAGTEIDLTQQLTVKDSTGAVITNNAASIRFNGSASTTYNGVSGDVIVDVLGGGGAPTIYDESVLVSSSYVGINVTGSAMQAVYNGISSNVDIISTAASTTGAVMTGFVTLHADPTDALHATTKQYVDNSITNISFPAPDYVRFVGSAFEPTTTAFTTDVVLYADAQGSLFAKTGGETPVIRSVLNPPVMYDEVLVASEYGTVNYFGNIVVSYNAGLNMVDIEVPAFPSVSWNGLVSALTYGSINFTGSAVSSVNLDGYTGNVVVTINAMKHLSDDANPALNGDLDTSFYGITSSTGTLLLKANDGTVDMGPLDPVGNPTMPTTINATGASLNIVSENNGNIDLVTTGAVTIAGNPIVKMVSVAPASPTAAGTKGDVYYDAGYVYLCVATNTWIRIIADAGAWV